WRITRSGAHWAAPPVLRRVSRSGGSLHGWAGRHVEVLPALHVGKGAGDALEGQFPELVDREQIQVHRAVAARAGQESAVRTERHVLDATLVAEQREQLPPARKLPELGCAIQARSGDERSVRAHGYSHDRTPVPPQSREFPARRQIPDLR